MYDRPRTFDTSNDLDAWKFSGYPGLSYTAKDQCEILLRDHEAYEFVNGASAQVCENLHCRTPNRPGFFFAGPALQGTTCGNGKWCDGGTCQNKKEITSASSTSIRPFPDEKLGVCNSECLQHGRGVQKSQDYIDSDAVIIHVCDDKNICKTRKSIVDYGTEKCNEFSKKIQAIDGNFQFL